jgi:hypothetical protein
MAGLAALGANVMVSFEQPHPGLLCASAILACAAPSAVLGHLWAARGLTPDQKRTWIKGLTSRQGAALLAMYFDRRSRDEATARLTSRDRRSVAGIGATDRVKDRR